MPGEELWKANAQSFELLHKQIYMSCSLVAQRQITHTCTITDLTNFSIGRMNYGLVQNLAKITQDNYPEQLGIVLIVNAPWSFTTCWSICKSWLDEKTRSKFKVVGGKAIDELRKHIDED